MYAHVRPAERDIQEFEANPEEFTFNPDITKSSNTNIAEEAQPKVHTIRGMDKVMLRMEDAR